MNKYDCKFPGDCDVSYCPCPPIADDRPWAQTYSGRVFPLVDPEPSDIHWPDIIYGLAHCNRFAGHVGTYSVAQHSILVADQLPPEWRLYGLLHDAHEFIMGDLTTPAAKALQWYGDGAYDNFGRVGRAIKQLKAGIDRAIYTAAGCGWPLLSETTRTAIHEADVRAMMTERRDLMKRPPKPWGAYEYVKPLPETVIPWRSPEHAVARYATALGDAGLAGIHLVRM